MGKLEVEIREDMKEEVEEATRELGIGEGELVDRAVIMFLDSIRKEKGLEKEFNTWEKASDEALENFEQSL
jgi:hypothetical protein